ncbi:hypothetical protein [Methylobacterium sp. Leaf85]|uniref:hypothetical protein n=1 Tax=Methylobacterium sp. Leaf85 TaxID=1736241 RepID=UPI0007019982|nr:hypothetical protein [Methylobacterium sp. Leaf85]KQO53069.1 hypothetical protein ASF08_19280 [Methylobacterium sp. Leaf85]
MFKLATKHTFLWPVTVRMPDPAKPGAVVAHTFTATFEAITQAEAAVIDARIRQDYPDDYETHSADYILDVTHDWQDVVDAGGEPVPFSKDLLAQQLGLSWFRRGIVAAYSEAMNGQAARQGN